MNSRQYLYRFNGPKGDFFVSAPNFQEAKNRFGKYIFNTFPYESGLKMENFKIDVLNRVSEDIYQNND